MKAMVCGDIHINVKRFMRSKAVLDSISEITNAEDVDYLILLGDVFDEHEYVHTDCIKIYKDFIRSIKPKIIIIHILGNHEMINSVDELPDSNALEAFTDLKRENYYAVTKPTRINNFACIPYLPPGLFAKHADQIEGDIILCHQEFQSAFYGHRVSTKGDPTPDRPTISGHIHTHQQIGKVWYPGTPYQTNFSEEADKGIFLISFFHTYTVQKKIPLKVEKLINLSTNVNEIANVVIPEDSQTKLVIEGTKSELLVFKQSPEYAKLLKTSTIQFKAKMETTQKVLMAAGRSFLEILREYAESNNVKNAFISVFGE